jgi:hypothetical protein
MQINSSYSILTVKVLIHDKKWPHLKELIIEKCKQTLFSAETATVGIKYPFSYFLKIIICFPGKKDKSEFPIQDKKKSAFPRIEITAKTKNINGIFEVQPSNKQTIHFDFEKLNVVLNIVFYLA